MSAKRKKINRIAGGIMSGGTQLGLEQARVGLIKTGVYTPVSKKKEAAASALKQEQDMALAEQTAFEQSEKERKKRNSLFQSTGGEVTVGGRKTLYGN